MMKVSGKLYRLQMSEVLGNNKIRVNKIALITINLLFLVAPALVVAQPTIGTTTFDGLINETTNYISGPGVVTISDLLSTGWNFTVDNLDGTSIAVIQGLNDIGDDFATIDDDVITMSSGGGANMEYVSFASSDGSEFQLETFKLRYVTSANTEIIVSGYKDGSQVVTASQGTLTNNTWSTIDVSSNTGFDNVDEIRITNTSPNIAIIRIDDITIAAAVASNTAPSFTSSASATVDENTSTSTVILDINANDGDGGVNDENVTYSLSGADAADFTIDSDDGELRFAVAPDFETPADNGGDNVYNITVTADDGEGSNNTTDQAITITVTDVDEIAPTFNSAGSTPTDDATGVSTTNDIVLDFSENIVGGNGNIILRDVTGASNIESFDASSASATSTPSMGDIGILNDKIYINPTSELNELNAYSIRIDAAAIDDVNGNSFAGISDDVTYNFTTADETAPTFNSVESTPNDDATDVSSIDNIVMDFSEEIAAGTGVVTLKVVGGAVIETFDVSTESDGNTTSPGAGRIGISGDKLYLNPTDELNENVNYAIQIAATAIDDLSGNSFAGISDETTYNFTKVVLVEAGGLSFDGANDYVQVANNSDLEFSEGTIEMWLKPTNYGNVQGSIIAIRGGSTRYSFHLNPQAGTVGLWNGSAFTTTSASFTTGEWNHFALVISDSNVEVFVNGTSQGTISSTINTGATGLPLIFGAPTSGATSEMYNGEMDEVRIWDKKLSSETINLIKNNQLSGSEEGLVAYYNFNNSSATVNSDNSGQTTLTDSTSNGLNGTLNNFALSGTTSNWSPQSDSVSTDIFSLSLELTTSEVASIADTTATLGGEITSNSQGLSAVIERGVVYSSTDTTPEIGETGVTKDANGAGTGTFSKSVTGLSASTTYYVQAYAINSSDTSYGGVETFTTTADVFGPVVTGVSSTTDNGYYSAAASDTIEITIAFSENVIVTGTPQLELETGTTDQIIDYNSGSGTNTLSFQYVVQEEDSTLDLEYTGTTALSLNGGTIQDAAGNDATLTFATPGAANSLSANKQIIIDNIPPELFRINAIGNNGFYKTGSFIVIQFIFTENLSYSGTPQLELETGETDQLVDLISGNNRLLNFAYMVQAGDESADLDYTSTESLTLNGATITDVAGNPAILTLPTPGSATSLAGLRDFVIDGVDPTVTTFLPEDNSTGIAIDSTLHLVFSEDIRLASGNIQVIDLDDGSGTFTINVSTPGTQASISDSILTINPDSDLEYGTNYAIQIAATAIDDLVENSFSGIANDTSFNFTTTAPPGFTIAESDDSTAVSEKGTEDSFTVVLDAEPSSNVVIDVTSGDTGEGTASASSLTFTPANWDTPQTVTITGVDDDLIDSTQTFDITLSVNDGSSDDAFDGVADQTVSVDNTDDDVAGFTIAESGGSTSVSEEGTTDTFTVVLDVQPGSNVVINLTSSDTGEGTLDASTLTFTPANWDTPQQVTVTGVDDSDLDGSVSFNVTVAIDDASSDDDFDALADQNVSVTSIDDEVPDTTPPSIQTTSPEDGSTDIATNSNITITFSESIAFGTGDIVLVNADESTVTETFSVVGGSGDNGGSVTISGSTLTINPGSDLQEQTQYAIRVDAGAIEDVSGNDFTGISDLTTLNFSTADESGPIFNSAGSTPNDDATGVAVGNNIVIDFDENIAAGTGNITIRDVTGSSNFAVFDITTSTATSSPGSGGIGIINDKIYLNPTTELNYETTYSIRIDGTAIDDESGNSFAGISGDVTYNFTTATAVGFTLSESDGNTATTEAGGTDSLTVVLDVQPASDVVLDVTSGDTGEGTVDVSSLTFTNGNWNTPQTVTVTGVDDDIIDGTINYNITLSVNDASSDDAFDDIADQTVGVDNTDDDVAGFTVNETDGNTSTTEAGGEDTFTVVLDAEPSSNVVIDVTSGDTGEATASVSSLTFTPANWDTPQTVTITGVDDDIIDGTQTFNITLSINDGSSDDNFDGVADQTVSVDNTDDDVAGFTIAESGGSTSVSEEGTTDTFTVVLDAQPGSNVVINLTSGDTGEGTLDASSLTFTPANWDTPQQVTVTGVDDSDTDGNVSFNITLSIDDASSDDDFDALADQNVSVTNSDDEVQVNNAPSFTVPTADYGVFTAVSNNELDISAQEGGASGMFFNNTGSKLFVIGTWEDTVFEYQLSTAFDVSSASYSGNSFSVRTQTQNPEDVSFNNDGSKMYIVGGGFEDSIFEYDLSTPFDITTASYNNNSLDLSSQETGPTGMKFDSDGDSLFIIGSDGDEVNSYVLSTPFDITTASYISNLDINSYEGNSRGLNFDDSGDRLFIIGNSRQIREFNLSEPYTLSGAVFSGNSRSLRISDVLGLGKNPGDVVFKPDGSKVYIVHTSAIYELNLAPTVSFIENGTGIVTDVQSHDGDGGATDVGITYTLSGTDAADFNISANGEITFKSAPDYEDPHDQNRDNIYEIYVTADDGGDANSTTDLDLKILVNDIDDVAPVFNSAGSTPNDNATDIALANDIVIDFDENIAAGTGNITIRDVSGSTNFEVFDITTATATSSPGTGGIGLLNDKIYLNPTSDLNYETSYSIQIDGTAIADTNGNSFAGISDETTYNFTTVARPFEFQSSLPDVNATGVSSASDIELTFSNNLDATTINTTNITIRGQQSGSITGSWSVLNKVATFAPTENFTAGEVIHVEFPDSVASNTGSKVRPNAFSFTVAPADTAGLGTEWTSASSPEFNRWRSVTYGNGRFVAVSQLEGTDRIMYSDDGLSWSSASAPENNTWFSVTYGNGRFVAISSNGTNQVMYSEDGETWTSASAAENNGWQSVTYGNGRFVAVSNSGVNRVMYSDDGENWTATAAAEANSWSSVTYGNGRFIAVSSNGTNRVMYSDDGVSWIATAATAANSWGSVTYGNGLYVAVSAGGDPNRVMYSANGETWTAVETSINAISSVTYGNGRFVAVTSFGTEQVLYSSDGVNWESASATEAAQWTSITYGDGRFVAVAYDGTNQIMYTSKGFRVTETAGSTLTAESGSSDTLSVVLSSQPASDVVITVTSGDTGEGTLDKSSLTFTNANWDTPQTVIVTGVDDDFIDGTINYNITLVVDDENSDAAFAAAASDITIEVSNNDDDVAGFTIAESDDNTVVSETGTEDSFTVVLDAEPSSNVMIDVTSGDTGEGTASASSLTFTPANWDTPQTVTITGVDDDLIDSTQTFDITLSVNDASSDDAFDGVADQTVSVDNTDDDVAGFTIAESGGSTIVSEEGTTDTFTVVLDAQPGSNVVINLTSGDTGEGTLDASSLTFTPANWDTPQPVTVTGVDDSDLDGNVSFNVTVAIDDASSDDDFDALADQTVSVTNTDDEAIQVSINDTTVTEGTSGTATLEFTVSLSAPAEAGGVNMDYSTADNTAAAGDDYTAASGTITFAEGELAKTISVTINGDQILESNETFTITLSNLSGSNVEFGDTIGIGTITNDDTATVTIANVSGDEDDGEITLTAVLDNAVQGGFTVDLSTSDSTATVADGDYTALSGETLTFTGSAGESKEVTVTLTSDSKVEDDETLSIAMSNLASTSLSIDITDGATVTILNDDTAGFTVTESDGTTMTNEEGTTDDFTVVLSAQPGSNVVINVTSGDTGEGTIDNPILTFTPANWNTPQTVTVSGVDDSDVDSEQSFDITLAIDDASSDDYFDALPDQTISVTNTDDDAVLISVNDTTATEVSSTLTFTINLSESAPGDITVDYALSDGSATTSDNDYTAASGTVAFNIGESSKTVNVTLTDDSKVEADETFLISLSNNTGPSLIADTTGTGTITNDDEASITIADVTVDEEDGTATFILSLDNAVDGGFTVELNTSDSTATIADGDYIALSGEIATFSGTAGETEEVSVTINDDSKVEANELVKLALSSLNTATVDSSVIDITDTALLTITNDDQATLLFTDNSGEEDAGDIQVTVTLNNPVQYGFTVDVSTSDSSATIADNDYTALLGNTLTFAGTAGETQQFNFTPTSDGKVEADEIVALSFSNLSTSLDVDITDKGFVTISNDDNAPVFTSEDSADVAENQTTVLTVVASDLDGMSIAYSITGGVDESLFSIDASSGVLTFDDAPDFENPTDSDTNNEYKLTVEASDGTNAVTQDIVISVTDVDDITPVFTSQDIFTINENEISVATITASDGDAISTVTFEISDGVDSSFFDINSQTGVLTFETGRDYESPADSNTDNVYEVQITATDGTNSVTQDISVSISDVNEFSPVFISEADTNLTEGNLEVLTIVATDADTADTIMYLISGGADASLFSIDSSEGLLSFNSAPDFESPDDTGTDNEYNIEVTATDGTNNTVQLLTISVSDLNEFAPVITSDATAIVYEGMNEGTELLTVTSSDGDGTSVVSYSIISNVNPNGNGTDAFAINSTSGLITLADPDDINKQANPELTIQIQANDGQFTANQTITITVLTPPVAESISPENGAEDITLSGQVSVTFDQDVQTIDLSGISIVDGNDNSVTGLTSSLTDSTISISYQGLANFTIYTVIIPAGAVENEDGVGNLEVQWQFTTIVDVPEQVVLLAPIGGTGSVSVQPTFAWETIARSESAIFQISTDSLFATDVIELDGNTAAELSLSDPLDYYETYYWRVRGVNVGGEGPWSSKGVFVTEAAVPQLTFPINGATGISTAPNIQWSSLHQGTSFEFHFDRTGAFTDLLRDLRPDSTNIQLQGLEANTDYFWRVRVFDEITSSAWSEIRSFTTRPDPEETEDDPIEVTISFGGGPSDTTSAGGGQQTNREVVQTDYRMVGLPGTDQIRLDEFFDGPYKKSWRAFIETGDDLNFYDEYSPEDERFVFVPGLGFWVLSTEIVADQYNFTPVQTNVNDSYGVYMHPGWNIIANPYRSPVEWELVREFNDITGELYGYEEQFQIEDTMEVLKGYYYYNPPALNMDTLFIPYTGFSQRGIEDENDKVSTNEMSRVVVEANLEGKVKHNIEIVYSDTAEKYRKQLHTYHPELGFAKTGLVMSKDELQNKAKLNRTLDSYNPEGQEYNLELKTKVGLTITWKADFNKLPDDAAILLVNKATNEAQLIHYDEVFRVKASEPVSKYTLYVGDRSYLKEIEQSLIPDKVELRQNYPNPFNPQTTINYALAEEVSVHIEVYDILGRLVATLVNNETQKAGWHKVAFDGSRLASGVYFYRLNAGKEVRLGKMTLIK